MENKFLTKKTKINIKEEASPPGLRTYKKVHDEDAKINKDALKAIAKKLADYYGDEIEAFDPPKVTANDEVGSDGVDVFNIEALGSGKMSALEYEGEGSEVEKKFQKRVDDLNDTSEYDKTFGTKDGFGETDKPDDTYDKLKKAAAEYNKYEDIYELPNPLRVIQAKQVTAESKNNKTGKMKRLNFKNEFTSEKHMKTLIPENYKVDGNIFLMTDGNELYKVRWDKAIKEATVLGFKNKTKINEDVEKMKKLFNYKYSDSMGTTNDYITETKMFKKLVNKKPLNEQWEWLEDAGEYVADVAQDASEYVTDTAQEIGKNLDYIWNDVKRAFSEVPQIPESFAKLAKYISNPEQWKEVAKGFEQGAEEAEKITQVVRNLDDNLQDKIREFLVGADAEEWCKRTSISGIPTWPPCIILDVLDDRIENNKYSEQDEELNEL